MATPVHILTANRLRDGEVVYWRQGGWTAAFDEAERFVDPVLAKAALAAAEGSARDRLVVKPYLFEARTDGTGMHPVKEREIIRAAGPTVRRDLGKQALHVPL